MRILVAGGCGFVGAALCRHMAQSLSPAMITAFDSFRRRGSEINISDLRDHGVRVVHGDLRVAADVEAIGPFDWVIDAAAEPSVVAGTGLGSGVGRRQLVDHNLLGTVNLLEAAARWQAGFVMLSTSRVYSIEAMSSIQLVERPGRGAPAFVIDDRCLLPTGASSAGFSEQFSTAPPVS